MPQPALRRRCPRALLAIATAMTVWMTVTANAANPGYDRPGLGFTPAVLRAGDMTWEQGLPDWSEADGVSLYTGDALLRVGLGGPFELQLGTSYNRLVGDGSSNWGRGDSNVGVKFALPAAGNFSWGVLGSVTLTDGARAFSGDTRQYLLGAAFNWQLDARNAVGAYLENVHAGGANSELVAFNAGRALTDSIGAYVEVAWQHAAGAGNGGMAGAGATWMVTPRVQLDASFRHRISGAADTWEGGLGVSVFFGRL